ncbi:hypothetical protein HN51_039380 [Arachis hypogaea]
MTTPSYSSRRYKSNGPNLIANRRWKHCHAPAKVSLPPSSPSVFQICSQLSELIRRSTDGARGDVPEWTFDCAADKMRGKGSDDVNDGLVDDVDRS